MNTRTRISFLVALIVCGSAMLFAIPRLRAAAPPVMTRYVSTSGADSDNDCTDPANPCATIAYAVAQADPGDTVQLAAGTYTQPGIRIRKSLTIAGHSASDTIVQAATTQAAATDRVFYIDNLDTNTDTTVTISGVTITNGNVSEGDGGGILNDHGVLTLANCAVSGNSAFKGGGLCNDGDSGSATLTITNSTISNNSAGNPSSAGNGDGGGIYNLNGSLNLSNSTISDNSVDNGGGGIANIGGTATADIFSSTLSGNSGVFGGAIANAGSAMLTIGNTILKSGASGVNIYNQSAAVTSQGYNLSNDAGVTNFSGGTGAFAATGDQTNVDPMLGPLADNGGPTATHLLLTGSLAIDKGKNLDGATTDQRGAGFPRTVGTAAVNGGDGTDIGAVELGPFGISDSDAAPNSVDEGASGGTTVGLTASATNAGGATVSYSLVGDTSGGGFTINASSGVVTVANAAKIDYESAPSHSYTVTVKADNGVAVTTQPFDIDVTDEAPSAPVDKDASANTVPEHSATGTAVGVKASASDVNGGTITYSLTSDSSGGGFTINASSGVVTVANGNKIDYSGSAPGHSYSITAQASDGTLASSQSFTVAVTSGKPPPHQGTANGSGTIFTHNNQASFSFSVSNNNKKGKPSGTLTYTDSKGGIMLTSTSITGVKLVENQASITGTGTIPGAKPKKPTPVSFTAIATDNGTPGTPKDTFLIQISTSYSASGNLTSGNITVK